MEYVSHRSGTHINVLAEVIWTNKKMFSKNGLAHFSIFAAIKSVAEH
jgi:hypothetical protein